MLDFFLNLLYNVPVATDEGGKVKKEVTVTSSPQSKERQNTKQIHMAHTATTNTVTATTANQGGNNNYGKFEALSNNSKASEFATELGFITPKEREDYFYLLYLQNLPVTDYNAFKGFRLRLGWEITEIAGDKKGNQSTVWNVVSALNTLREKGNWIEEGNTFRGSMNDLYLHSLYSNIKAQVDNVIELIGWEKGFEDVVKEIVFNLYFDNPYAA